MQTATLFEDALAEIQFDDSGSFTAAQFDEIIDNINVG